MCGDILTFSFTICNFVQVAAHDVEHNTISLVF